MSDPIDVVAAVIRDHRGYLLVARRPDAKRHGGLWEFPGGKVDPGESLPAAVDRELEEELALTTESVVEPPLLIEGDPGHPFRIIFMDTVAHGTAELMEHTALAWIGPPWQPQLPLAPSDAAFVQAVRSGEVALPGVGQRVSRVRVTQ